tara:strand:+ start:552 stop:1082 length:531 start_codon:yes stop_codon:yes gene_type:complete
MEPITLSIAASIAGSALSAFGAVQSGQAQAAAANYQAQVARVNQQIQTQNAAYERQKGDVDSQQQDMKNKAQMGALEAAQGASGFDMNMGSSLDTRESARKLGRLDTLTTRNNAERRAHDFDVAAMNQGAQAGLYSAQAKTSSMSGYLGAATSILGGVGSVSDKWIKYNNPGSTRY